jgi:hypothetical protein
MFVNLLSSFLMDDLFAKIIKTELTGQSNA